MNDRFLRACRGESVDRPPLWIMRQAGRYLPEYRELRGRADFLSVCRTPELAVEASLQPIRRFGFDAAIVFSDILLPLEALGVDVAFDPGPRLSRRVRTSADVAALRRATGPVTPYVGDAIALLARELGGRTPVIGFAGGPFTLAAYLAEGESGGSFGAIQRVRHRDPEAFARLLALLADLVADTLSAQIRAGADAVQIFDSWAGLLGPADFRAFALPAVRRVLARLERGATPVIYFAVGGGHVIEDAATSGADVIGVCWRTPLDEARRRTGGRVALQGNLDPHALFGPPAAVREQAWRVLDEAGDAPGHIMNLGHGILPETPIEGVEALVEAVASRAVRPA